MKTNQIKTKAMDTLNITSACLDSVMQWANRQENKELLKLPVDEVIELYTEYQENIWDSMFC